MDMNDAFPSEYLKASDLKNREVTVTMANVAMQDLGGEHKPVLYFRGADKGLVLNKTNTNTIIEMYGAESDGWVGKRLILFPTQTDYQGRQVACIRVKLQRLTETPSGQTVEVTEQPEDPEIPF